MAKCVICNRWQNLLFIRGNNIHMHNLGKIEKTCFSLQPYSIHQSMTSKFWVSCGSFKV